ncbi:MAG: hypothetical protein IT186_00820 [Acidobacteria bacterium]|nr:hypothetical protein [Acidobacteriota bacterium]MCG3195241.1 hypothetical protein [Thermoanaerobaculia bacterium]MCK6684684.1 hypothetical protein [Thermoanaerobaculia bacterium]
MSTPDVGPDAQLLRKQQLREIDEYLSRRWPAARQSVIDALGKCLGVKIKDWLVDKIKDKLNPIEIATDFIGLSGTIAKAAGKLGLWATGKALFYCYDDLYPGMNPYNPMDQLDLFVKFLVWTWDKNGKPSYRYLHD